MSNETKTIRGLLIIFGLFFVVGMVAGGVTYVRKSGKELALATITKIESVSRSYDSVEHDVIVEYGYDNVMYRGVLDGYDSTMYIGKVIEIYVNPNNPSDFTQGSYTVPIIFMIFSGLGFVLLLILPK